jgi:hypothetical protein
MYLIADKGEDLLFDPVKEVMIILFSMVLLYLKILAVFLGLDEPHEFMISLHHFDNIREMCIEPWALLGVLQMCRGLIPCLFGFFLHYGISFLNWLMHKRVYTLTVLLRVFGGHHGDLKLMRYLALFVVLH